MTQSRAEVTDVFESQLEAVRSSAAAAGDAAITNQPASWCSIDKGQWDGNVTDVEGISLAFPRDQLNSQFVDSVTDTANPGTSGDLVSATVQADYIGMMERAFRARHTMSRTRAAAHAAGRKYGHGHDNGTLVKTVLEFVRSAVKTAKGSS